MNAMQFRAIFHDHCKKNIVLLSWGQSGNILRELFCHISLPIPKNVSLPTYAEISFLMVGSSFLMTRVEETTAKFILRKLQGLYPQLQMVYQMLTRWISAVVKALSPSYPHRATDGPGLTHSPFLTQQFSPISSPFSKETFPPQIPHS